MEQTADFPQPGIVLMTTPICGLVYGGNPRPYMTRRGAWRRGSSHNMNRPQGMT